MDQHGQHKQVFAEQLLKMAAAYWTSKGWPQRKP